MKPSLADGLYSLPQLEKEWLAFVSITALHVWAGLYYGIVGVIIQLAIGCCVALLLIGAFRSLAKADRNKVR